MKFRHVYLLSLYIIVVLALLMNSLFLIGVVSFLFIPRVLYVLNTDTKPVGNTLLIILLWTFGWMNIFN